MPEYIEALARAWWAIGIGVILAGLGIYLDVAEARDRGWLARLMVLFAAAVIPAQTVAWFELRDDRDRLAEKIGRPDFTVESPIANVFLDEGSQYAQVELYVKWKNIGDAPAYRVITTIAAAPSNDLELFFLEDARGEIPNRITPDQETDRVMSFQHRYAYIFDGAPVFPGSMLIFARIDYCDGNDADASCFFEEQWLEFYTERAAFAHMTMDNKEILEPLVRSKFSENPYDNAKR